MLKFKKNNNLVNGIYQNILDSSGKLKIPQGLLDGNKGALPGFPRFPNKR